MVKNSWYAAASPLYRVGWDTEEKLVARLQANNAPYEASHAHCMRIMETANIECEKNPAKREFWRGINDAAWQFFQELRIVVPRDEREQVHARRTERDEGVGADSNAG